MADPHPGPPSSPRGTEAASRPGEESRMRPNRRLLVIAGLPLALLVAIQLVPYGRDHSAPPDGTATAWSSATTVDLARRACFDCHSNETRWPWYSGIAPVSWRIWRHVQEGRERLNF